jgi:hypothetical protein
MGAFYALYYFKYSIIFSMEVWKEAKIALAGELKATARFGPKGSGMLLFAETCPACGNYHRKPLPQHQRDGCVCLKCPKTGLLVFLIYT